MTGRSRWASFRTILDIAIAAIALLQVFRVAQSAYPVLVNKVWVDRRLDAVSRSADAAYGQQYLGAIQALRQRIPSDGKLILTGTTGLPQYEAPDFIQYFLFPRQIEILDCPSDQSMDECILSSGGEHVYFIVGTEFEETPGVKDRIKLTPIGNGVSLLETTVPND